MSHAHFSQDLESMYFAESHTVYVLICSIYSLQHKLRATVYKNGVLLNESIYFRPQCQNIYIVIVKSTFDFFKGCGNYLSGLVLKISYKD